MRRSKAIVDERNYTVVNAGVRYGNMTREAALVKAEALVEEWRQLGYLNGRHADVFYWDGSLVASFPKEEVE